MQPADKRIALVSDVDTINSRVDDIEANGPGDIGEAVSTAIKPGGVASGTLASTIGLQAWEPSKFYSTGTRVVLPSGDVKVARSGGAGLPSLPDIMLSQWEDMPQVEREKMRSRSSSVRDLSTKVEELTIPANFLAKWNPGIKVFREGDKYLTNWSASHERNTGGRNIYFAAASPNGGKGGAYAQTAAPIAPFTEFTTLSVAPVPNEIPAGAVLGLILDGNLLMGPELVAPTKTSAGATTITINAAMSPATGIPAGADVIRPVGSKISNAYAQAVDGDTIIILDKHVHRSAGFTAPIRISVNIESLDGKTVVANSEDVSWAAGSGGTYVSTAHPTLRIIVDMGISADGYEYERKSSAEDVQGNPGSWHQNGSGNPITVHPLTPGEPDNTQMLSLSATTAIQVEGRETNMRVYLKGVTFIGGTTGVNVSNPSAGVLTFATKDCRFLWGGYGSLDASTPGDFSSGLRVTGNVVSKRENTAVSHSAVDGSGYSSIGVYKTRGLEVNCGGHSAGIQRNVESIGANRTQNISTVHDGGSILRIGGDYHGSYGGVIADVQYGTVSLNYGVDSHDSTAVGGYSNAFAAQQSGTEMWVIGCRAWGCESDVYAVAGTTVHVWDTELDTWSGNDYIDFINPR